MTMLNLPITDLAPVIWRRLLDTQESALPSIITAAQEHALLTERERERMDYKTGSIPLATSVLLTVLATAIRAKNVFELGTFIGRSTKALINGIGSGYLHTVDQSNPTPLWLAEYSAGNGPVKVTSHARKTSTEALRAAKDKVDLFFIDGRLQKDDLELMRLLSHERTVFAFDDFEGTEKGVSNISHFNTRAFMLLPPPGRDLLSPYGVGDRSSLAILFPPGSLTIGAA